MSATGLHCRSSSSLPITHVAISRCRSVMDFVGFSGFHGGGLAGFRGSVVVSGVVVLVVICVVVFGSGCRWLFLAC